VRIDLTGEPAGTVTATEAQHAMESSAALAKVAAKRASKVASGVPKCPKAPARGNRPHGLLRRRRSQATSASARSLPSQLCRDRIAYRLASSCGQEGNALNKGG
jgi:sRNA-binding protein